MMRIVAIGHGVLGGRVAFHLARARVEVPVIDQARDGRATAAYGGSSARAWPTSAMLHSQRSLPVVRDIVPHSWRSPAIPPRWSTAVRGAFASRAILPNWRRSNVRMRLAGACAGDRCRAAPASTVASLPRPGGADARNARRRAGLGSATVIETRIGFRPVGPDILPLLGWVRGVEGVAIGNALGAGGLTMGPYVGKLWPDIVLDVAIRDLTPLAPLRVAGMPGRLIALSWGRRDAGAADRIPLSNRGTRQMAVAAAAGADAGQRCGPGCRQRCRPTWRTCLRQAASCSRHRRTRLRWP